ncbi:hypothetical protein CPL00368_CDS0002 [Klebsiella phage DevonBitter]
MYEKHALAKHSMAILHAEHSTNRLIEILKSKQQA